VALAALLALSAACAGYVPFDGSQALAPEFERRLGAGWQQDVTIPFAIDEELRRVVDERVSPAGSETRRRDAVLDFIFGLVGLEYELAPTRTANEAFAAARGNCLSFVNLFVAVGRERRLNPFFVEVEDYRRWNYQNGVVVSRGHIVAGMYVDGEMATYDFLPYRPKSYRDFRPITDLAATGHYYNNLGAEALMNGDLDAAERWLETAVRLTPDFDKAINNHAIVLLRRGRLDDAARRLPSSPLAVPASTATPRAHPAHFPVAPPGAIGKVPDRAGWSKADVDSFEINEAFACVPMMADSIASSLTRTRRASRSMATASGTPNSAWSWMFRSDPASGSPATAAMDENAWPVAIPKYTIRWKSSIAGRKR